MHDTIDENTHIVNLRYTGGHGIGIEEPGKSEVIDSIGCRYVRDWGGGGRVEGVVTGERAKNKGIEGWVSHSIRCQPCLALWMDSSLCFLSSWLVKRKRIIDIEH